MMQLLDSKSFAQKKHPLRWLVDSVLVARQPAVIGGPQKSLKTSLALDLAISQGTGLPFLNCFPVPRRGAAMVISGESGQAALQDTARRICTAKGTKLEEANVFWSFQLPRFTDQKDLAQLKAAIKEHEVKTVILDPLYLSLTGGEKAIDARNLYEVGPALQAAAKACLTAGATPIFVHHTTKAAVKYTTSGGSKRDDSQLALGLQDLAYAGIAEFARQWLLVRHARPYSIGSGHHELVVSAGGSAGHSGLWRLTVDEGMSDRQLRGREWDVLVEPLMDVVNGFMGHEEDYCPRGRHRDTVARSPRRSEARSRV